MPFESKSQARFFFANKSRLEKEGVDVDEWASKTDFKHLPEKKKPMKKSEFWATEKLAMGGTICKGCGKQSRNCTCPPTMKAAEISDDEFWATDYIEAKTGSLIGSGMLDELGALGNNERFLAGADVAGLGMLAAPSAYELATGDKVDDKTKNQAELGGLGVLAATQIPKFIHSTPSVPRLAL